MIMRFDRLRSHLLCCCCWTCWNSTNRS